MSAIETVIETETETETRKKIENDADDCDNSLELTFLLWIHFCPPSPFALSIAPLLLSSPPLALRAVSPLLPR